eukprot:TRINITY_DN94233_c0_g1_i1.p1 TRINITY_DN94233_c0_g1~~TRINITY_DN94233_c0_g1_i1.p1  ORF type:complete len:713 (+),score=329.49 TRINITY_DN94233_c0_g1_i1:57-2141(+)
MKSVAARCLAVLALSRWSAAESPSAVTRVVELLTSLKANIGSDNEKEQAVFDKYACWCEETTKAKAEVITENRNTLTATGNKILELKGRVATTIAEIKELMSDIKKNEEAQQQLTNIRQKENAAFEAEKSELMQASQALQHAIMVLKSATGGAASLLSKRQGHQVGSLEASSSQAAVAEAAEAALSSARAAAVRLPASARPQAERHLASLAAEASKSLRRYTPQSATIQGILSDMYETFSNSLETRISEESTKQRNYEDLMATYHEQLQTLKETLQKKETVKTEAEKMLADATQEYASLEDALKADVEFFDATKASCIEKTEAWSTRKGLRTSELEGIDKALEILTSDEAKELFAKADKPGIAPSLLQVQLKTFNEATRRAFQALRVKARQSHSLRLAALAAAVSDQGAVGHFEKVIEAIDLMIETIHKEEKDDISLDAECKEKLTELASKQEDTKWKIKKNEAKIAKLDKQVTDAEAEKEEVTGELEKVYADMNTTKADRETGNADFLVAKEDDEKAIGLLEDAKAALSSYYSENDISLSKLLQVDPEPEAKFSDKANRKLEAKGITSLLATIIEDLKNEIANGIKDEEAAQLDFEKQYAAAEAVAKSLEERITNLDLKIADDNEKKSDEETAKTDNEAELTSFEEEQTSITPHCDWIKKNLPERRRLRTAELEGLAQAKSYLAGQGDTSANA